MPLRGLSVLVVEDDRDYRELARDMLTALGARVTVAANGDEGVKHLIATGCPDLILCDLRMPVMDGYEFAREVRTHSPCRQARLVALTAVRRPPARHRPWRAGAAAPPWQSLIAGRLEGAAAPLRLSG